MPSETPVLSICIPTYNNAENLPKVLDQVLSLEADDIEVIVSDDASTDNTESVVGGVDDNRLRYIRNKTNKGYEQNLLKTVELAQGTYYLPLADEAYLVTETVEWVLNEIRTGDEPPSTVLADFRWQEEWTNESWQEAVPTDKVIPGGRESLLAFISEIPHPFAEHTWRRNYIGGFVLRTDGLDVEQASTYDGSAYIHNVLIIQSLQNGPTLVTPRELCISHFFEIEGDHRFWTGIDWADLEYRTDLQTHRLRLIREAIEDPVARDAYLSKEEQFAAHLAAWSVYSTDNSFRSVRRAALSADEPALADIWRSPRFYARVAYYLAILPLPVPQLKRNLAHGFVAKRAVKVWQHILARIVPDSVMERIERFYEDRVFPLISGRE